MQTYLRIGVRKMVRDQVVPDCISQGCRVNYHVMDAAEQRTESRLKVLEEAREVAEAATMEETLKELADLTDAIEKFMESYGITESELMAARIAKQLKKGAFKANHYLTEMDVPTNHPDIPNFLAAPDKYTVFGEVTEAEPPPSS